MAYYKIKDAADKVGVPPHVLRFWESQFPKIRPPKSSRGQRVYSEEDVNNLLTIKHLLYTEGYSISGAKKVLKEQKNPGKAQQAVELDICRELVSELNLLRDFVRDF